MKKQLATGIMALTMVAGAGSAAMAADTTAAAELKAAEAVPYSVTMTDGGAVEATPARMDFELTPKDTDAMKLTDMRLVTAEDYAAELAATKAQMKTMVAEGQTTQKAADTLIARMEVILKDLKSGELQMWQGDTTSSADGAVTMVSVKMAK